MGLHDQRASVVDDYRIVVDTEVRAVPTKAGLRVTNAKVGPSPAAASLGPTSLLLLRRHSIEQRNVVS
jgi:hypothetical protein